MNRPEEVFQKAVVRFLAAVAPDVVYYHVPNQRGTRKGWEQGLLTAMGLRKGVADLCLVLPGGGAGFLELKSKTGSLSKDQRDFRDAVVAAGARYAQCRTLDDVQAALTAWGVETRGGLT